MKLIAESGSTRTEWALVEDNRLIQRAFTEGLNPFFQTRREISRSVRLGLPEHFWQLHVACSNARPALLVFWEPAQTHVFMMGKSL